MASLDGLPERPARDDRILVAVGVLEALSLLVLLGNLATVHLASVAQAVGPVHGLLWLSGVALTWTRTRDARPRWISVIPVVGALLAARVMTRRRRPARG